MKNEIVVEYEHWSDELYPEGLFNWLGKLTKLGIKYFAIVSTFVTRNPAITNDHFFLVGERETLRKLLVDDEKYVEDNKEFEDCVVKEDNALELLREQGIIS